MELLRGVIHGRVIELENEPGLPDGQSVTVVVQPAQPAIEEAGGLPANTGLRRAFGAWAEDAKELDEYLEWNRRQRRIGAVLIREAAT
jgi:hypothetical protein